jgi:hypothetical protein
MLKFPFTNSAAAAPSAGTPKIDVCVRMQSASGILSVRALLAARVPLILKVKAVAAQILQADSLKRLLAPWFVPPIMIPIMLVGLILGIGLYRAYS